MPLYRESETICQRRSRPGPDLRRGAAALVLGLLSCSGELEPERPVLHYSLASDTQRLGGDGLPVVPEKVQAHIKGSLEMLFGTPSSPQYLLLGDWIDDGFDPNYPQYAADDMGSGELGADELERLSAENARSFGRQLELIAAERYGEVRVPDYALDLAEYWHDDLLPRWQAARGGEGAGAGGVEGALDETGTEVPEDFDAGAFEEEARAAFVDWYPTLRESAELYRVQCLHCHGAEGGGNGPTAKYLNPLPRDYRRGVFKFTSQKDRAMPSRRDLHQILARGVTGTAMPSFRRFSDTELNGLVDYVRLLSMRGMVERDLTATFEIDEALPAEYVLESYQDVFEKWLEGGDKVVAFDGEVPAPTSESIARGKALFEDAGRGNCASCHGTAGRGDGVAVYVTDPETGALRVDKRDDWGHDIMPRNIPQGIFRGGRRPIDIYRRIYAGINGTPMPALGDSKDPEGNLLLSAEDLWALVHYVGYLSEQGPEPGAHRTAQAGAHAPAGEPAHAEEHGSQHEEGR